MVFTAAIDGAVYAKHGTTFDTRLTTATVATQSIYGDGRTYLSREFDADVYSLSVETSANPAN